MIYILIINLTFKIIKSENTISTFSTIFIRNMKDFKLIMLVFKLRYEVHQHQMNDTKSRIQIFTNIYRLIHSYLHESLKFTIY